MTLSRLLSHRRASGIAGLLCILTSFVAGCASDAKQRADHDMIVVERKSERQTVVELDGAYSQELAEDGEIDLGDKSYVLQHEGKTYYFDSAEDKDRFEKNLRPDLSQAQQNWINRGNAV